MTVHKLNNIFSEQELLIIDDCIEKTIVPMNNGKYVDAHKNNGTGIDTTLGRIQIGNADFPDFINNKIKEIADSILGFSSGFAHVLYAEYSNKYGMPNLPAHFDHDDNNLVIDFQLSSNTSWNLGVDFESYTLTNNSAIIFNANEHIHWRPKKIFKDNEYVKMLFFRFYNPLNRPDYSHLDYLQNSDIFKKVNEFINSLGYN